MIDISAGIACVEDNSPFHPAFSTFKVDEISQDATSPFPSAAHDSTIYDDDDSTDEEENSGEETEVDDEWPSSQTHSVSSAALQAQSDVLTISGPSLDVDEAFPDDNQTSVQGEDVDMDNDSGMSQDDGTHQNLTDGDMPRLTARFSCHC